MSVGIYNVLTWLLVGLAGGSLAALALTARTRGFGLMRNLMLGVIGALVGGGAFAMFNLFPNLDKISISARDLLAAVLGSLVVYCLLWVWQKLRSAPPAPAMQEPPPPA